MRIFYMLQKLDQVPSKYPREWEKAYWTDVDDIMLSYLPIVNKCLGNILKWKKNNVNKMPTVGNKGHSAEYIISGSWLRMRGEPWRNTWNEMMSLFILTMSPWLPPPRDEASAC